MKDRTKTWVVNTRIDIRTLATLVKFYMAQGIIDQKKSTPIRLATEHFKSLVVLKHPEFETETFQEAIEYLERIRLMDMEDEFPGKFSLVKELQKEGHEIELRPSIKPSTIPKKQDVDDMVKILDQKLKEIPTQEEKYEQKDEENASKEP